jgi:hypothetical protein
MVDEAEIELEDVETEDQETDSDSSPDTGEVQEKQTTRPDWHEGGQRFDPVHATAFTSELKESRSAEHQSVRLEHFK